MKNVLYTKTIAPSREREEVPAILVWVTEEANGFAVFTNTEDGTDKLLQWFPWQRNNALEWAIDYAREQIKNATKR